MQNSLVKTDLIRQSDLVAARAQVNINSLVPDQSCSF